MKQKLYIAGPMNGIKDHNHPAFFKAEGYLKEKFEIINPASLDHSKDVVWADFLRTDIKELVDCDAIYMLDGWTESKGAKLEHHIAEKLGLTIYYEWEGLFGE